MKLRIVIIVVFGLSTGSLALAMILGDGSADTYLTVGIAAGSIAVVINLIALARETKRREK